MTTATVATGNRTMATVVRPRRSLEELVDQLFAAMGFKDETETAEPSPTRSIHEARRLRQAGQALDGALAVFAGMDMAKATTSRLRKKGKALSRSVWSLNCLGGIRHVIGQFE